MNAARAADWRRQVFPLLALPLGLFVIALATALVADRVTERVVTVMFIDIILVVGLQLFMGNSGLSSFGHIAFMLIGAYGSIWFTLTPREKSRILPDMPESWPIYDAHLPFIPAILAGALIATAFGALIGIALVRLRGASFTIATFALLVIVHSVAIQWEQVTRGARTVIGIHKFTGLWMAVAWALVVVVLALLFKETALGLKLRATREDEDAAASVGINAALTRWIAWTISVFVSALAGGLWAHFITTFSPNAFYLSRTFLIVAMLIIGGTGSVSGAVIGAVAVALTSEGLRRIENWANIQRATETTIGKLIPFQLVGFTEIVIGVSIILVLILRPSGLTGGREIRWPFRPRPRARGPRPQIAPEGAGDAS